MTPGTVPLVIRPATSADRPRTLAATPPGSHCRNPDDAEGRLQDPHVSAHRIQRHRGPPRKVGQVQDPAGSQRNQPKYLPKQSRVAHVGKGPDIPLEIGLFETAKPQVQRSPIQDDRRHPPLQAVLDPQRLERSRLQQAVGRQAVQEERSRCRFPARLPPRHRGHLDIDRPARQTLLHLELQQEVRGPGQEKPACDAVAVHLPLDGSQEVGHPLDLVHAHAERPRMAGRCVKFYDANPRFWRTRRGVSVCVIVRPHGPRRNPGPGARSGCGRARRTPRAGRPRSARRTRPRPG